MTAANRTLTIKQGVVQRLIKDISSYEKEESLQRNRISKLEADGADMHDIRKQYEVLKETTDMIPDTKKRLQLAVNDLEATLGTEIPLETSSLLTTAKTLLQ